MNQYDEMKNLLKASREMLGKSDLNESRKSLIKAGLINEQEEVVTDLTDEPVNVDVDSEEEIDIETTPTEDKSQSYRVSGGIVTLHGKDKQELEMTTEEKIAFQETMDDFVEQVSDLSDFGTLHIYPNNVEWSGKVRARLFRSAKAFRPTAPLLWQPSRWLGSGTSPWRTI